ncbi:MAG TPA: hypothetical protein VLG38_06830, partial [Gammaproteobacteria bacterium]|nr:hypothetical protein [Gammaproteobacteria bacterium]
NLYLALFTIISFLIYFACLLAMRQINGKLLLRLVLGWLISGTVALPLYLPSILLQLHHPLIRDYNNQVSITLQGVLTWSRHDSFSIGLVSWVLIGVTLAKLWIDRKKITKTWIYLIFLLIAIIGICAGLGPNVSLGHKLITDHNYFYTIPYHIVPGYKALRIPMRWFLLASLGVSVFVSYGAMWLLDLLKGKYKKLQYLFVAIFAAWIIFEQFPTPIKTYENYQIKDYPAYQWLASQPGDFAILELPIFPGTSRHANDIIEARRMFLSTYHWKKRVSGAITPYIPDQYVQNARVLNAVGDNPDALTLLKSWQVQYIIFIPGDFATLGWGDDVRDSTKQRLDTMKDLSRVGTFNDTTIYKIKY